MVTTLELSVLDFERQKQAWRHHMRLCWVATRMHASPTTTTTAHVT